MERQTTEPRTTAWLRWLGCTTFVLRVDGLDLLLDAYVDRVPGAPSTGVAAGDVDRVDAILLGHSHAHHIADAPAIARRTGAPVICHPNTASVLRDHGVTEGQIWLAAGGERFRLSDTVTVRTFPSLHACDWMPVDGAASEYQGRSEVEREALNAAGRRVAALLASGTAEAAEMQRHLEAAPGTDWHGGVMAYLIEWSGGSLLFQDSLGCWSGLWNGLRPDVAILSAAGVPNLDGDPFDGDVADFVALEAGLLGWPLVIPCHHDNWMPPFTSDSAAREERLEQRMAALPSTLHLPRYGESIVLQPTGSERAVDRDGTGAPVVCPVCEEEAYALFASTDEDGAHTRLFCERCAHTRMFSVRIHGGTAQLLSVPDLGRWTAARMLRHAMANERRRSSR